MNSENMNSDLASEMSALRNQVYILLLALIVVSGTLTVYLYRQASITGKDINASNQLIAEVNQSQVQIITLANQLAAYGRTHPDIVPLLTKYGIGPNGIPTPAGAPKK
jgi:hypothetical protein